MRHTQRGFTLVELMVVVAIIAILGALMVGMSTRPYGANAATMSDQLVSEFSFARMRSISTRKLHRVTIYTANGEQLALVEASRTTGMSNTTGQWDTVEFKRIPKST